MGEGGPNERWGVRKTPAPTWLRVNALPRGRYATHTPTEVHFLSVYFFSVYIRSLLGSFGAISATLWRPMGQSPSKTKVLPTCNAVHRLMLSTHHLGRTHVPPFCVTPCPSFPGGIAACAAPPLPPLPPRGLGFVHVPLAQETMAWGGVGGDMCAVEAAGPFCRPICVCFLLTWALVPRLQGIFV